MDDTKKPVRTPEQKKADEVRRSNINMDFPPETAGSQEIHDLLAKNPPAAAVPRC